MADENKKDKSQNDSLQKTKITKESSNDKSVKDEKTEINFSDKFKGIRSGDEISLKYRIKETLLEQSRFKAKAKTQTKERLQSVEGLVIARKHGSGVNGTITIRTQIEGVGTERIFPVCSPLISDVIKKANYKVRRSKLYYLRNLSGRAAKLKRL
ncbi:MAG: 50S ribosomal protein L19 [Patescibacteria group bacterium]